MPPTKLQRVKRLIDLCVNDIEEYQNTSGCQKYPMTIILSRFDAMKEIIEDD